MAPGTIGPDLDVPVVDFMVLEAHTNAVRVVYSPAEALRDLDSLLAGGHHDSPRARSSIDIAMPRQTGQPWQGRNQTA
jgi:hypothetical protein